MTSETESIVKYLEAIGSNSTLSRVDNLRVQQALSGAVARLQSPWDIAGDHFLTQPSTIAAIEALSQQGVWTKWVEAGGQPISTQDLSSLVDGDPVLIKRLVKHLAGQHLVTEQGDGDVYGLTGFSRELANPHFAGVYTYLVEISYPTASHFPKYIAGKQYRNPTDFKTCNLNDYLGPGKSIWTLSAERPDFAAAYRNMLTYYGDSKIPWTDIYPTKQILDGAKSEGPLLVDVAGGVGVDLLKFLKKHPDVAEGSLVLEDLPNVLDGVNLPTQIKCQPFDLMKPQPVHGARAYFLHMVLHDWPDSDAVAILKNIAPAMEKGYSKILIHEIVVESKNAHPWATTSDLHMMLVVAGAERSDENWKKVIKDAGLEVVKIWKNPQGGENIIELERR